MPSATYPWPVSIANGIPSIVNPGSLNHAIQFEQQLPTGNYDEAGTETAYAPFAPGGSASVNAAIEPYRGRDVSKGGQTVSQLSILIVLWYVPGILPNMRVTAPNGSKYLIQAVENVLEMNYVLILYCLGLGANV